MNIDDSRVEVEGFWLKVGDKSYPVNRIKGIKIEKLRKLYPPDNNYVDMENPKGCIVTIAVFTSIYLIAIILRKFISNDWIISLLFIPIIVILFFILKKFTQPTREQFAIASERKEKEIKEYEERNKKRKMLRNVKVEFDGLKPVTVCKGVAIEKAERIKGELESAIGKAMMKSTHSASD